MAITSTLTTSFKKELLTATHNFATGGNSFKLALYTSSATTARGCMIYNDTAAGDPSVATIDFGGDKTSTAGDFTIVFPAAASSTAIIRIA
jgi:hypothetical protein